MFGKCSGYCSVSEDTANKKVMRIGIGPPRHNHFIAQPCKCLT